MLVVMCRNNDNAVSAEAFLEISKMLETDYDNYTIRPLMRAQFEKYVNEHKLPKIETIAGSFAIAIRDNGSSLLSADTNTELYEVISDKIFNIINKYSA